MDFLSVKVTLIIMDQKIIYYFKCFQISSGFIDKTFERKLFETQSIFYSYKCSKIFYYLWTSTLSPDLNDDFTLKGYLLGGVKLTKNADPDKPSYFGYGIEYFNSRCWLG